MKYNICLCSFNLWPRLISYLHLVINEFWTELSIEISRDSVVYTQKNGVQDTEDSTRENENDDSVVDIGMSCTSM
jgi:hypothetical protein